MVNPLHLILDSKAGSAATVLRLILAAFLLHDAFWQGRQYFYAPVDTIPLPGLAWASFSMMEGWFPPALMLVLGLSLFAGFLTRATTLFLLISLIMHLTGSPPSSPAEFRELILYGGFCLALMISGAGAYSIDKKISSYLLPSMG